MYAVVQKWGNSNGIRIPKNMLDSLNIRENDKVELEQAGNTIIFKKAVGLRHRTLEDRLTSFYGKPISEIERVVAEPVDWGKARGDEIW